MRATCCQRRAGHRAVTGSGSNYVFTFPQPAYGPVAITWAAGHGITDYRLARRPAVRRDRPRRHLELQPGRSTAPTIAARCPAAGATVTNLTQVTVTFSEPVSGVDAADFLVNGAPAFGLSGGGSNYTFSFSQPPSGTVTISWAANHGIADLAAPPNAFNATGPGATWSYTLDTRTVLVQSNSPGSLLKGTAEASTPVDAWRQLRL